MSRSDEQWNFLKSLALLITWAESKGYKLTGGDLYRDPRLHGDIGTKMAYGHPDSYHKKRLAIDLNLFIDNKYQTSTEAHRPLGEYWESLGGTWGGRFNDANHYSWGEARGG